MEDSDVFLQEINGSAKKPKESIRKSIVSFEKSMESLRKSKDSLRKPMESLRNSMDSQRKSMNTSRKADEILEIPAATATVQKGRGLRRVAIIGRRASMQPVRGRICGCDFT